MCISSSSYTAAVPTAHLNIVCIFSLWMFVNLCFLSFSLDLCHVVASCLLLMINLCSIGHAGKVPNLEQNLNLAPHVKILVSTITQWKSCDHTRNSTNFLFVSFFRRFSFRMQDLSTMKRRSNFICSENITF